MKRIKVLSTLVSNQIAAGEVIERPASVVKELVENAIDAMSKSVTVETTGGGIEYIRVADNGGGINADDVRTAFMRHATSKISESTDLERIATLGFRGEALASIASVARVSIKTRTHGNDYGTLFVIEGGEEKELSQCGCPEGTTVEIRDLFFNVPARLKFLKNPRSESAYIADYIARMIMARPNVAFTLIQNGNTVYKSAGDGNLFNAIYAVYGSGVIDNLRRLSYDDGYIKITGYVGTETLSQSTRAKQSFVVNGRYIKSQKLSYAVQRAFETRIMKGKFPFIVLNIAISSHEIDVNVHPNKLDVRFKNEERVCNSVTKTVLAALVNTGIADANIEKTSIKTAINEASSAKVQTSKIVGRSTDAASNSRIFKEDERIIWGNMLSAERPSTLSEYSVSNLRACYRSESNRDELNPFPARAADMGESEETVPTVFIKKRAVSAEQTQINETLLEKEKFEVKGCLFDTYWIIEQGNTVFFLDQHAAHERKLYNDYINVPEKPKSQVLLVPQTVKLDAREYDTLINNLSELETIGFDIEDFGAMTISVRAVPAFIGSLHIGSFISDAVAAIRSFGKKAQSELLRASLIQSACKHAIKAGQRISDEEIQALLEYYSANGAPLTCPHGRPVMVKMTKKDFEKMFKRVV
ncbi:MAG: DNA mismatch repair endonuclease MutL [Eubacteriales bacterium]|nr:DNA mismatch repair endonuclease MutL [Eubacteriales bacterium]